MQPSTYRYSKIGQLFYKIALIGGLFIIAMPIFLLTQGPNPKAIIGHYQAGDHPNSVPVSPLLEWSLYAISVVTILFFGILAWRGWQNEKITVQDGVVTWTDTSGRVKVQSPLADVLPGGLVRATPPNTLYALMTKHGDIKWNGSIDNCGDLVSVFAEAAAGKYSAAPSISYPPVTERQPSPPPHSNPNFDPYAYGRVEAQPESTPHDSAGMHIVAGPGTIGPSIGTVTTGPEKAYNYRTARLGLFAGFASLWVCGLIAIFTTNLLKGRAISGFSQQGSPWVQIFIFALVGIASVSGSIYLWGFFFNAKIVFDGQGAVVYNWAGAIKGHYSFRDLKPDSLTCWQRYTPRARIDSIPVGGRAISYSYSVVTADGTIKWSDDMNGGAELYERVLAIANRSRLTTGSE
ncbi:MAG TPA: hypothetical protein VGL56_19575 [Fimbriimonadaceae bacterium]|jgi:hypothetical protein